MTVSVCFLGFGEAAQSFCDDQRWRGQACGYDIKSTQEAFAAGKANEFRRHNIAQITNLDDIGDEISFVLSLVTADQSVLAAKQWRSLLRPGSLFVDMNSVAPSTKQSTSHLLSEHGVDYVDVAIMAPVYPKRLDVPLLISGEKANAAEQNLRALGFQNTRIVGEKVGQASSIKMLRSVMIKGIEALTAECAIAAYRAGVLEEVFGSMGPEWLDKVDYNLDRMMVHGQRRAAEMSEVVKTLIDLGVDPHMSAGTVQRQHNIGVRGIKRPPDTLTGKLTILNSDLQEAAE